MNIKDIVENVTPVGATKTIGVRFLNECAERHHELKYGSGYNEAHNRAQTRFDGVPWENQF